ncbi:hypothetical protein SUGI_0322410 [Cryptomeria japonica]|nr:hypothetical protein SUGI_0322410 [Cryptomeria japonica]
MVAVEESIILGFGRLKENSLLNAEEGTLGSGSGCALKQCIDVFKGFRRAVTFPPLVQREHQSMRRTKGGVLDQCFKLCPLKLPPNFWSNLWKTSPRNPVCRRTPKKTQRHG